MTRPRDLDRVLEAWLHEGASEMPDRLFDSVIARIEHVPQRRLARIKLRFSAMSRSFRVAAATAAIVVVAVVGLAAFGRVLGPNVGNQPAASATPQGSPAGTGEAQPSPTLAAFCPSDGCEGAFTAGSHTSSHFRYPVTFTVPAGWANSFYTPKIYSLERQSDWITEPLYRSLDLGPSVYLIPDPQAAVADASCGVTTETGIGSSSAALATWIATRPGIVASAPKGVTIGGRTGEMVDVSVASSWPALCRAMDGNGVRQDPALPYIPLIRWSVGSGESDQWEFGPVRPEKQRYIFVDVAGGHTVAIVVDASPVAFDAFTSEAMPVAESMTFAP